MANIIRKREGQEGAGGMQRSGDPYRRIDPFRAMRTLLGWDPFGEIESFLPLNDRGYIPDIELRESKDAYIFKADLPGVDEKDVEVSVMGNHITISGRRMDEETKEDDRYHAYERSFGSFSRSFGLPQGADVDNVKADLKSGVLCVTVPKKPEVQPKRIPLSGAGAMSEKREEALKTAGGGPSEAEVAKGRKERAA
jgi:HSP20 family protein